MRLISARAKEVSYDHLIWKSRGDHNIITSPPPPGQLFVYFGFSIRITKRNTNRACCFHFVYIEFLSLSLACFVEISLICQVTWCLPFLILRKREKWHWCDAFVIVTSKRSANCPTAGSLFGFLCRTRLHRRQHDAQHSWPLGTPLSPNGTSHRPSWGSF